MESSFRRRRLALLRPPVHPHGAEEGRGLVELFPRRLQFALLVEDFR
ncbi:MAG: hypothetical protein IIA41_12715 [SAR324 cluster bacterium]|nr:hypothetical protein [SAR324 cluster bacterium]